MIFGKYVTKINYVCDMNIITQTSQSMNGYFINVSFITQYNNDTWTSQPYHFPIQVWNEQIEAELKKEFKQFVLSKSTN